MFTSASRPFSRELLHQLVKNNLITLDIAIQIDPLMSNDALPKWHSEAFDMGLELSVGFISPFFPSLEYFIIYG